MRPLTTLAALLAAALLGGCGLGAATAPTAPAAASVPAPTPPPAAPAWVTLPTIAAHSTLVPLGLNPDGTVEVPSLNTPMQAGWYTGAATPGRPGPAVLLGHVDSRGHRGIFYDLPRVAVGDPIMVGLVDGSTLTYRVTRTLTVAKVAFPTREVYGPTSDPQIRVITCGGALDTTRHNYLSSVIVFGTLET